MTRFRAPGRGPEFTNHSRIPELSHIISHSRCFLDIHACKCFNTGGKFRTPPGTRSRQSAGPVFGENMNFDSLVLKPVYGFHGYGILLYVLITSAARVLFPDKSNPADVEYFKNRLRNIEEVQVPD